MTDLSTQQVNQFTRYDKDKLVDNVIADPCDVPSSTIEIVVKGKKKRDASALRKAPQAPKRFKSSYIMFFMAKQQEIKAKLGVGASVGDVSKQSSDRWKKLTLDERAVWDQKAKEDKERYNLEKASYTGPWQVPWKRAKKDPNAPKRPMSAFLFFSQDKRKIIKGENPGMRNTEISRVLGELWKEASDEEKSPHIKREARERAKYKVDIAKWRKEDLVLKEDAKKEQIEQAKLAAQDQLNYELQSSIIPVVDDSQSYSSQHSRQTQPSSQSQQMQQYYQGGYGYSDYQQRPLQGYGQVNQYYDNSFQQDQGTYYNSAVPGTNSRYQQLAEGAFPSDPSSSHCSIGYDTSGGTSQYMSHPVPPPQSHGHHDGGYYSQQGNQNCHLHPSEVTSYEAEYDAFTPQYGSQPPTHDNSNYPVYP